MTNTIEIDFQQSQKAEAEIEGKLILDQALQLSKAYEEGSKEELLYALDNYLKLWVDIETNAKKNSTNSKELSSNLIKLSKFVEKTILSSGMNISKEEIASLVNANIQVAAGLFQQNLDTISLDEALSLLSCASNLSNANDNKNVDEIVSALDENMKLWVYIKTKLQRKDNPLPEETKADLLKIADYMSSKTLEIGQHINNIDSSVIESMVSTNLQVTEGLVSQLVA